MTKRIYNSVKVFDIEKSGKPGQSLLFGLSCMNCEYGDTCSKSPKERENCAVNYEITNTVSNCNFCARIETDSTKFFVDIDNVIDDDDTENQEDKRDTLKQIKRDYTNDEILNICVPKPIIPFIDTKRNGRN